MVDATQATIGVFTGGISGLGKFLPIIYILVGLGIFAAIIYFIVSWAKSKKRWSIKIRVRMEDTQNGTIYLDPVIVRGQRVTLSNGLRLIFLEKPILGKRLFPMLNYHTRPGVYDLIITSDNRIFIINGISGIDEEKKRLNVGIRYPGIDYSLEEINRDHSKLNQMDRKSDLLGIVKAASIAVVAIVLLVGLIVGGKYWVEGKEIENQIAASELLLFENIKENTLTQEQQTNGMILLVEKMKDLLETNNLQQKVIEAKNGG